MWRTSTNDPNPAHHNTPLVIEAYEGDITVTDPAHPLYGKTLKLIGIARLPGFRRCYQVEIFPDEVIYVNVEATNLGQKSHPTPTRLTLKSLADFLALFRETSIRRELDEKHFSQSIVEPPDTERTGRGLRTNHPDSHGGDSA